MNKKELETKLETKVKSEDAILLIARIEKKYDENIVSYEDVDINIDCTFRDGMTVREAILDNFDTPIEKINIKFLDVINRFQY